MSVELAFILKSFGAVLFRTGVYFLGMGLHVELHLGLVHEYFVAALFRALDFEFFDFCRDEDLPWEVGDSFGWFYRFGKGVSIN